MIAPEDDNQMGFSQGLGNFASPRLTRLNVINVLEDEGFVNAEQFNYRSNQRRVGMAIGHKDVGSKSASEARINELGEGRSLYMTMLLGAR